MKVLVIILLSLLSISSFGQDNYFYIKTNSFLREYPDTSSKPFLALFPPCKIKADSITDKGYRGITYITDNWYAVNFFSSDGTRHGGETFKGYVQKQDLTRNLAELAAAGTDTSITIHYAIIQQNGEQVYPPLKFLDSSHGDCYYINSDAKKEYISAKYCNNE